MKRKLKVKNGRWAEEHELKCWSESFEAIGQHVKTFDVRRADRDFQTGDTLLLREFVPCKDCGGWGRVWDNGDRTDCGCKPPHGRYTSKKLRAEIKFVYKGGQFGIDDKYVVLGIACKGKRK